MFRYNLYDHEDEETEDDESDGDESEDEDDEDADEHDGEAEEAEDLPEEDDAMLARLDKAFRDVRARIRASTDVSELRSIRAEYTASLSERLTPTVRLRTLDVVELVDERVTDLRARRAGSRSA